MNQMASRRMVMVICTVLLSVITCCHCVALSKVSSSNPPTMLKLKSRGNSTQIKTREAQGPRGRMFIGHPSQQSATLKEHLDAADYQSDMGWDEAFSKAQAGAAKHSSAEVHKLMQTEPNVECTGHSMKLKAQGSFSTPGSLFMVDRGSSLPPLPLLDLPPSCGFTLNTTNRDLVLEAPYDGCFISVEEEGYVLLLRWWGIPVRLYCPAVRHTRYNPPIVTCNTAGMVVKTEWTSPVDKINVNLNGHWEPLMQVLPRCGFGCASNPGSVSISIHFDPCVEVKDGMFSLGLRGDGAVKVSCPSLQVFDGQSDGLLPTVSPMRNQNLPPAGNPEGQKQDKIYQPAIFPPYHQSPLYPHRYPFPYLNWPPHPSGSPDHSHRYYPNPLYPPVPASPLYPLPKPPKTHVDKNPVGQDGQNTWPYKVPLYFRPPPPSRSPDLLTPGDPQEPSSPNTEEQEPATAPNQTKTKVDRSLVIPEGNNPDLYTYPYFYWPPHLSPYPIPDQLQPYYPNPFYPPSGPDGHSQKPVLPTLKNEGQKPDTQSNPPKTDAVKNPAGQEGQTPWPYPFPYYFWPPQPSRSSDLLPSGIPHKPSSPTSKTERQEPSLETQVDKSPVARKPTTPDIYPFPYFNWPPHPSAHQTPDKLQPYYPNPFYPPYGPEWHSQKPSSPTSKTDVQEPTPPPKPPKAHVDKNPVGQDGKKIWPSKFPLNFWPPPPSQSPDLLTPGDPQEPSLPNTEEQEPATPPNQTNTQVDRSLVIPEGKTPNLYKYPNFYWPPHLSAYPTPDHLPLQPYYPNPFYPPTGPDGHLQNASSPTSRTDMREPTPQPKPPKTQVYRTPVPVEGQNANLYPFPYLTWPPHPSGSQVPDPFPFYQNPLNRPAGTSHKNASSTSKTDVTTPKPPTSGVITGLPPRDPLAKVVRAKPSPSEPVLSYNPPVQCPQQCPSGLSQCCVTFNYHQHDHFIYPYNGDRKSDPFLKSLVPEALQGTPRAVQHDSIETSYETILNPSPQNEVDDLPNFVSQEVKHTSKRKEVLPYSPTEDIIWSLKNTFGPDDQESPQSLDPSQSMWGAPTYTQPYELPTHELQSQSPNPVHNGQITFLDSGKAQYDMFQDATASSGESADYLENLHHFGHPWKFEKLPSEDPFSNGYVLLEHGPPGTDPNGQTLEASGLGSSRTHLVSDPLSDYQKRNAESNLSQRKSQMDFMYRSGDIMTSQEPHQYVPLSYPGQSDQFQSENNLGQSFKKLDSSVVSLSNGDVNQPVPRNGPLE